MDVQYYSHLTKELKHSQVEKAQKFLEHNCIQYKTDQKCFTCQPLPGYNTREYTIKRAPGLQGGWICNCQYSVMQQKKGLQDTACSHILALHLYFVWRNKRNQWGPYKKLTSDEDGL